MSADKQGRPYAKVSEIGRGDRIELDSGFTCAAGESIVLYSDGLYFPCSHGRHYLSGQEKDGYYVGIYKL